jgi:hypothetical protein
MAHQAVSVQVRDDCKAVSTDGLLSGIRYDPEGPELWAGPISFAAAGASAAGAA